MPIAQKLKPKSAACRKAVPPPPARNNGKWRVPRMIRIFVEVGESDVDTMDEAVELADRLLAVLPLEVKLGRVDLESVVV